MPKHGRSGMNCVVFYALCRHSTAHNNGGNVLIPRSARMYYNEKLKWIVYTFVYDCAELMHRLRLILYRAHNNHHKPRNGNCKHHDSILLTRAMMFRRIGVNMSQTTKKF